MEKSSSETAWRGNPRIQGLHSAEQREWRRACLPRSPVWGWTGKPRLTLCASEPILPVEDGRSAA